MQKQYLYPTMRGRLAFVALVLFVPGIARAQPVAHDTLFAPTPTPFDGFGYAVTVTADPLAHDDARTRLLVTEAFRFPDGAVYVYTFDQSSNAWVFEDSLGHTASGSGQLAWRHDLLPSPQGSVAVLADAGQVAVWRRNQASGEWEVEAFLSSINKPGGGQSAFGAGISAAYLPSEEELIFIGAQNGGDTNSSVREGSAYAFVRPAGEPPGPDAWTMEARILAPDGIQGDQFGVSVALLPTPGLAGGHPGDALVLIGANLHPRTGGHDGAVYVYTRDGATGIWSFETKFVPADLQDFDRFGTAVALLSLPDGAPGEALAVVGSSEDDDLAPRSGAAYAFRREYVATADTFRWVEETKFLPFDPGLGLQFGAAVALSADTLAGGTPVALALVGADPSGETGSFPSEASLFVRSAVTGEPVWIRRATYQTGAKGPQAADWFGHAVGFVPTEGGPLALVGAYYSNAAFEQGDPNGTAAGAVFIYDTSIVVAGEPEQPDVPSAVSLSVYPNPVRGEAVIRLGLPRREYMRVVLYDVLGREVAVVHEGVSLAGEQRLALDMSDLTSGVYVLRVESERAATSTTFSVVH